MTGPESVVLPLHHSPIANAKVEYIFAFAKDFPKKIIFLLGFFQTINNQILDSMNIKLRLTVMNFLQFAVWGSYLVCIGNFLGRVGLGSEISWFYVVQGTV